MHEYLGLGQGNPINGEFSVNLFLGYKIENGKLVGRVKDVMLAGNAFDALKRYHRHQQGARVGERTMGLFYRSDALYPGWQVECDRKITLES